MPADHNVIFIIHYFVFVFILSLELCSSRAYAFGREMVCSQKSIRNRNFFENAGHVSLSFCQTGSTETHTKPCKTSPQGTPIKRPAIYWDHAVSWGGKFGLALAISVGLAKNSDIGRVGKKMVLRRIPIYFLSTISHDLKPKLASFVDVALTFSCPADHVPDWQPRIAYTAEARSVNV